MGLRCFKEIPSLIKPSEASNKIYKLNSLFVSQINLDLLDFAQDLLGIGIDIGLKGFKVLPVIGFMDHQVLFEVCNFNIDFSQADFQMDPDGNYYREEAEKTNSLWQGKSEYGMLCAHEIDVKR